MGKMTMTSSRGWLQEVRQPDPGDGAHAEDQRHRAEDHADLRRVRQGRTVRVRTAAGDQGPDQVKRAGTVVLALLIGSAALAAETFTRRPRPSTPSWKIVARHALRSRVRRRDVGSRRHRTASQGCSGHLAGRVARRACATCSAGSDCRISRSYPRRRIGPGDHVNLSGQPGFDVRLIGRQLVVTTVDPDGGAAAAGVHPGWMVQSIGGTPVATLLAGIAESTPPRLAQLEAWRLARAAPARPVRHDRPRSTFIDGAGATVTKSIERQAGARRAGDGRQPADDVRARVLVAEADAGAAARPASSGSTSG